MRTLIVGALATTLVGCSCFVTPQSGLEACTGADGFACLDRNSGARQRTAPEPSPSDASTATPKEKAARRATTMKQLSAHSSGKTRHAGKAAKSTPDAAKVEPAAAIQPPEIDPVVDRAKIAVLVKLEDPKSATFGEIKRSMRKNLLGQSLDTICGHVKSKKASGEDIGDRPFVYLVKDDVAFIADDSATSAASTAYRNTCN
ncbi:hypothetical protein [Bradyrhizobium sp.]|uniref:hypothetical protein n=1 Tax=Bradyrhizobium sp. TaxID=376 RepID=UPI0040379F49